MWLVWMSLAGWSADFDALLSDSGWESVGSKSTNETGPMSLHAKTIAGTVCVRAVAEVDVPADTVYEVITDVPAAQRFSSETLLESRVLGRDGANVHYYQHLDVPGWTMASDRYWVLSGHEVRTESSRAFRWQRFDWKTAYPDLAKAIASEHPAAVEPLTNYGSWVFEAADGGKTRATYLICSDPGGSLPEWLKRQAATKTLPNTVQDVMREARKRAP